MVFHDTNPGTDARVDQARLCRHDVVRHHNRAPGNCAFRTWTALECRFPPEPAASMVPVAAH